jgi:O-antigen ligase
MNILPSQNSASLLPLRMRNNGGAPALSVYPRWLYQLFYLLGFYLVIPVIDIPFLGLSLSAPAFFIIAMICIFKSPRPWFHTYRRWIILAALIWTGIFTAAAANGLLSGGTNIGTDGILTVIRYAFWLLVFVVTAYFASHRQILLQTATLLGWGGMSLALLRWGEVIVYGNIGAWTGTHLLYENDYGFIFSLSSPFLLFLLLRTRGIKWWLAAAGNVILWGAAAVNGSRGSWTAIGIGLLITLALLVWLRPTKIIGLLFFLVVLGGGSVAVYSLVPEISNAVQTRLDTFQNLETDKSYMIRQLMNQKALNLFQGSPLIGVGAARFQLTSIELDIPAVLRYASQAHFDKKSAHNAYLGFLAENGLVGAVPLAVLLVVLSVQGLRQAVAYSRRGQYWALAVFVSFVQMSIHMWVIASLTNTVNWFIYGLVGALIMLGKPRSSANGAK